jgi:hypothetical protein
MELEMRETEESPSVSKKLIRAIIIGASVVGLGAWLFGRILHHTIPPIIIRSVDDDPEPIEVESPTTLIESSSFTEPVAPAPRRAYTKPNFGRTKYVKVLRKNTATGVSAPPEEYKNKNGLVVQLWLQHKQGGTWHDELPGPQIIVAGTANDFRLESDQLSMDKSTGNPIRQRKRSYNKNKHWRIGTIEVDGNSLSTAGFDAVTIAFDNHF